MCLPGQVLLLSLTGSSMRASESRATCAHKQDSGSPMGEAPADCIAAAGPMFYVLGGRVD